MLECLCGLCAVKVGAATLMNSLVVLIAKTWREERARRVAIERVRSLCVPRA